MLEEWVGEVLRRITNTLPEWALLPYPPQGVGHTPLTPQYLLLNPPVTSPGLTSCVPVVAGVGSTPTPLGSSRDSRGYLKLTLLGGNSENSPIFEWAHRFVMWAMVGPPEDTEAQVMHTCHNKACLSLHHLAHGSGVENHPSRNHAQGSGV
jgi:hypothetical protein